MDLIWNMLQVEKLLQDRKEFLHMNDMIVNFFWINTYIIFINSIYLKFLTPMPSKKFSLHPKKTRFFFCILAIEHYFLFDISLTFTFVA